MLKRLIIKNYALIDEVEIDFSGGLSTITGETGAGKSIMLGALGLLLGERADTKAIADKERKTIVEAYFSGVEEEELIVRREISPSGRSRAFIDDSPSTLQDLSRLTTRLLDIHSQHANLSLTTREGQLRIIDAMASTAPLLDDYRALFKRYVKLRHRIRALREEREKNEERREIITFQLAELKKLNPRKGELEEVERKFEMLSDADEIRESLSAAHYLLSRSDESALGKILQTAELLEDANLALVDPDTPEEESLTHRLKTTYIELKDIAETIESLGSGVESNPAMLAATGARMRALIEATRKFKVANADELVELRDDLQRKLALLDGDDSATTELESEARAVARQLKEKASQLSEMRHAGAQAFSEMLTARAIPLGLPNLKFQVEIQSGKLTSDGQDTLEFQCSFNKNGHPLPMATTASGGELSRLTLCIKSLMAEKMEMPTIIFDEIDTGVSGEIADKMGRMMASMASRMQIITITHLPQVAAKGLRHYKVYKRDTEERTISAVRELKGEERIREIAAMMSGESLSEAAINAARALLSIN